MHKHLQIEALEAEIEAVRERLRARTREQDPIGYRQFRSRLSDLEIQLAELTAQGRERVRRRELVLFFGGEPVIGSRGINAEFASKALDSFQQVISAKFASREGRVGTRGRIRGGDRSQMLLSDITRGSFGFVLEQNNNDEDDDRGMADTLNDVVEIIAKSFSSDIAEFNQISEDFDRRLLGSMQGFLRVLHQYGATMRVVSDEHKFLMQHEDIERAKDRIDRVTTSDEIRTFRGRLLFLASSRRFDLLVSDETTYSGTISGDALRVILSESGMPVPGIADTWCAVRLRVREVRVRGHEPTFNYQLIDVLSYGGSGPADVFQ